MSFRVTIKEVGTWVTDELTLAEAIGIEKATGHPWSAINPFASAVDCQAILVAFAARTLGAEEAHIRVAAMSVGDCLDAIDVAEVVAPGPKVESGSPTTG